MMRDGWMHQQQQQRQNNYGFNGPYTKQHRRVWSLLSGRYNRLSTVGVTRVLDLRCTFHHRIENGCGA